MLTPMTIGILALLVCSRTLAGQQSPSATSTLERLAVRAAVERAVGSISPALRIVIDPMIVHANEAPGGRDSTRRDAARNNDLIQSFQARTLARGSVIDCSERQCKLQNADVLVSLSEPEILGNDAKVTVTTVQRTQRGIQYLTVNVLFQKQAGGWRVTGYEELGIS